MEKENLSLDKVYEETMEKHQTELKLKCDPRFHGCGHEFSRLAVFPMEMELLAMKLEKLTCPKCGAGSKCITLTRTGISR